MLCHSSYSTMNSKPVVRESAVVELPQQFVTKQIHNSSVKKRLRNHRESIINEMKHTEDLLEETLDRNLRHPRSKFSPILTAQTTPRRPLRTDISTSRLFAPKIGGEVVRKLKQLCNISRHFDRACEYRQRVVPTLQAYGQLAYSLPVATPQPLPSPAQRKAKEELAEQRTMLREWESKARLGREFVKRAKLKQPLRYRDLNQNQGRQREDRRNSGKISLRSLRDIYFAELRPQRKTAPPPANNNLELLFVEQHGKRGGMGYVGGVEEEPALRLQKFIEGGEERSFDEFSEWLNLGQFKRSKEKYRMLEKLYNYVKENNLFEFKDMNADRFTQQTLLAVVYYLENAQNLTETEKRALRKKLKVVE